MVALINYCKTGQQAPTADAGQHRGLVWALLPGAADAQRYAQ
jgi:hypothetical protein